jgi:thiamine-phosphate pyrophosphorylase
VIRCLITNGLFSQNRQKWLAHVSHWIAEGIELVQIRERDLSARDLAELTRQVLHIPNPRGTRILVNDRADIAIACHAHGVHLRDGSTPWQKTAPEKFTRPGFLVTVACHSIEDADRTAGAAFVLLSPIFPPLSKTDDRRALGTGAITEFTRRSPTPVLALGGISQTNAHACMDAGAAGMAGITCFEL